MVGRAEEVREGLSISDDDRFDCFINTISMAFSSVLIDNDAAIAAFLHDECERNRAVREQRRAAAKAQELLVQ